MRSQTTCASARDLGHTIALFGPPQPALAGMRFSTDPRAFDRVVFLFEFEFVSRQAACRRSRCWQRFRESTVLLDADGRYNPFIVVDGYDQNYRSEDERAEWLEFYDALGGSDHQADTYPIRRPAGYHAAVFRVQPGASGGSSGLRPSTYDVLHVGHNWWRWKEVAGEAVAGLRGIRDQVGEIGFSACGGTRARMWSREAARAGLPARRPTRSAGCASASTPPVPYYDVIRAMSTGAGQHLHPAAVPRARQAFDAAILRGILCRHHPAPDARSEPGRGSVRPGGTRTDVARPGRREGRRTRCGARHHYRGLVEDVRRHLLTHHPYRRRVEELVAALDQ